MSLKKQLRGTGVALITPFKKSMEVDYDALEKLVNNLISNGVEYLVTLGTTGETPTLTDDEMVDIVNATIDIVNDRVSVVIGIGGNNTAGLLKNLQALPVNKCVAVLSSSPNYNKPSQEGIYEHYKAFAAACTKPVLLYNVPGRTGSNITAETTLRLAKNCKNIAGTKEASGNMVQCMHILKDAPKDFLFISGDDHLALPLIACGADGVISVAANCFAKNFSDLIRAALALDLNKASKLQYELLDGIDLLFAENNPAGVKAFLYEMGMIKNVLRLPLVPLSEEYHEKIKEFIATLS